MVTTITRRRFSVSDYYLMAEAGILSPHDRVELIDGEIVQMASIGSYHAGCVNYLATFFGHTLGFSVVLNVQNPVRVDEHNEPQPDLTLLKPRDDFYTQSHPEPGDVLLAVEVSHTTVEFDRDVKAPLYAQAAIPELWLVNLEDGYLDALSQPSDGEYRAARRLSPGDTIAPALLPDARLDVGNILGRRE